MDSAPANSAERGQTPGTLARASRVVIPFWFAYMLVTLPVFAWMIVSAAGAQHPWLLTWYWISVALNFALVITIAFVVGRDETLGHHRSLWVVAVVFTGALGALIYWWRHLRPSGVRPRPNPI